MQAALTVSFIAYLTVWIAACLLAVWLMVRHRRTLELFQRRYWRFLLQPWKVATFAIASAFLTVIAPYTGDPTWDYADALFMSVLTFATAPWVVATLYLALRGRTPWVNAYVGACLWMFSVSWSYDLYILLRDGDYPATWLPNLFLSSVLYLPAGLMWSLEWREGRGVLFQFTEPGWPERDATPRFTRIFWYALPLMILAAAVIVPFLV